VLLPQKTNWQYINEECRALFLENERRTVNCKDFRKDVFLTGSITNVEIQGEITVRRNSQSMISLKVRTGRTEQPEHDLSQGKNRKNRTARA
jgi:hypothetical protein